MRWLGEAELPPLERSKTDLALVEEASRYVMVQSDCLIPVLPSSLFLFSIGLQWGSIATFLDSERSVTRMRIRFKCSMGMEPPVSEPVECWDLVEASKDRIDVIGKGLDSDQIVPIEGLEKDIMEFLETKFQTLSEGLVRSLGSGRWSNWWLRRLGSAGGILVCWDKRSLEVMETEVGRFSVSCRFRNVEDGMSWIFTGVYGPFSKEDRDCLWEELGAIRGLWEDPWCLGGDFNVIFIPAGKEQTGKVVWCHEKFCPNS
ncbi:hypothetical protein CK203_020059 [Vitis vinifera]|uniref:Endonuclease/exonuclease/phosphatase domain-containing protein n=1 Tax=Vitis vinifera TaxID=29760 RepID=A0A438J885_VITVI|nr:hypothetical protein CK203_020059 [Vitis vinifera]